MDHLLYDPNDRCHTRGSITPEETRREETDERENERLRNYETLFFQINYVVLLVLILNDSTSLISVVAAGKGTFVTDTKSTAYC